jgi:hypothetical protein
MPVRTKTVRIVTNGGPAFPEPQSVDYAGESAPVHHFSDMKGEHGVWIKSIGGMSLRDYFAAAAMASAARWNTLPPQGDCAAIARDAYKMADALLAERQSGRRYGD